MQRMRERRFGIAICQRAEPQHPGSNQTVVKSMRRMRKPAFPAEAGMKWRALGLVAGWSALALYLFVYAPAGLGLAALAGSFDCNHQVQVRSGERGLALVLHHGRDCAGHRHGAIARALTCFAQPAGDADPDHVIQFGAADTLATKAQLALPSLQGLEQPAAALTKVVLVPSAQTAQHSARPHPPPGECEAARCLRATVLLI